MKTIILISVLLLPGCTTYEAVKAAAPAIEDKAADLYHSRLCNLRYDVEKRFLSRNEIHVGYFNGICGRLLIR